MQIIVQLGNVFLSGTYFSAIVAFLLVNQFNQLNKAGLVSLQYFMNSFLHLLIIFTSFKSFAIL